MSDEEARVFWGPVTKEELVLRWRLAMEEKGLHPNETEDENAKMDNGSVRLFDGERMRMSDADSIRESNGVSDVDVLSLPVSSVPVGRAVLLVCNQKTEGEKPIADSSKDNSMTYESGEESLKIKPSDKENIEPSLKPILSKSLIPVKEKNSPLVKPAKLKFDIEGMPSSWNFKLKKVPSKKAAYMISPSKVGLYIHKSKSTVGSSNLIQMGDSSRSAESIQHSPRPKFMTPTKSNKYSYVQSPIAKYIRNEAFVSETKKILPK